MATRNTPILGQIINFLAPHLPDKASALALLEDHYRGQYLVSVGDVGFVASAAHKLRLNITKEECALVLDYVAKKGMVVITIDHVETAINKLLGEDRFIEP